MSPQAIATLVLKVAALYCIIESIPWFGRSVTNLLLFLPLSFEPVLYAVVLGSLLSCTMLIALAALLFFKARQLVPLLIEPEGSTEGETIGSSGKWGGAASQRQAMETAALCKPWKNK